jgi:hypothetical protein
MVHSMAFSSSSYEFREQTNFLRWNVYTPSTNWPALIGGAAADNTVRVFHRPLRKGIHVTQEPTQARQITPPTPRATISFKRAHISRAIRSSPHRAPHELCQPCPHCRPEPPLLALHSATSNSPLGRRNGERLINGCNYLSRPTLSSARCIGPDP